MYLDQDLIQNLVHQNDTSPFHSTQLDTAFVYMESQSVPRKDRYHTILGQRSLIEHVVVTTEEVMSSLKDLNKQVDVSVSHPRKTVRVS